MTAMIITSALLMAAAIIFRRLFGKKLNGKLLVMMWAIVFIKLAVPINIPSAVSVMNLIPEKEQTTAEPSIEPADIKEIPYITATETVVSIPAITEAAPREEFAPQAPPKPSTPIEAAPEKTVEKRPLGDILLSVYAAVAIILEAAVLIAYIICAVRFSRFESIKLPEAYSERGVSFRKSTLGTPAVFGIFRHTILIPEGTDISDSRALGHIVLHEKTHIRHRDPLFNLLTLMICCANWYNPLAWVCRTLFLKDAERWCDETVIETIGSENRKAYAETLLACAEERSRPFMLISGFGESDIKARIKAISANKKLRRGAAAAAIAVILCAAAVFGTGKALRAEMTDTGFVPSKSGLDYVQQISGSGGENAVVTLNLNNNYYEFNPSNYYHFTIGIESSDYTLSDVHAEIKMNGAKSFRILPDGKKTDADLVQTCKVDFSEDKNDLEMAIDYPDRPLSALDVSVSYKLKKGIFTVGKYTLNASYDHRHLYGSSLTDRIETVNNSLADSGFTAQIKDNGYEIVCTDGSTDLRISFNDYERGAVVSNGEGKSVELPYFNHDYSSIECADLTKDGVNDLVVTTMVTGTGVIQNAWSFIDGASVSEIPVDTNETARMMLGYVGSGEFAEFAKEIAFDQKRFDVPDGMGIKEITAEDIFSEDDPYVSGGNLFGDNALKSKLFGEGDIRVYGGMYIGLDGETVNGRVIFGLVRNETEYSALYSANVIYRYENGAFIPDDIQYGREFFSRPLPDDALYISERYLTDLWNHINGTGTLDPYRYTINEKTIELIEETKAYFLPDPVSDADLVDVYIDWDDIEYGIEEGENGEEITWLYIRGYDVDLLKNGEVIRTERIGSSYFEFVESGGCQLLCQYELWNFGSILGLGDYPRQFPLAIDISDAIDKIKANQVHANDLRTISELGLPELIDRCETWDVLFCSDSAIDNDAFSDSVTIDGEVYTECRIQDEFPDFIPEYEDALGVKLELADGYYKCPFSTVEELRRSARRLFSDEYIKECYRDFEWITEYNGSLYMRTGGKGYPGGRMAGASIGSQTDDRIYFTVTFVDGTIGAYTKNYYAVKESDGWKLDFFRMPEEIEIVPFSKEKQSSVYFGSYFPYMLCAKENEAAFTDGSRGIYIFDFNEKALTLSCDIEETFGIPGMKDFETGRISMPRLFYLKPSDTLIFELGTYWYLLSDDRTRLVKTNPLAYTPDSRLSNNFETPDQQRLSHNAAFFGDNSYVYLADNKASGSEFTLPSVRIVRSINGETDYYEPFNRG